MTDHTEVDEQSVSDHADRRASDRRRSAKLRERREQAGQVRISAWVPRERADHARQVLRAAAAGANTLPPDPSQQADLDAARAEAATAWAELEATREAGRQASVEAEAAAEAAQDAGGRAEATALARAASAERERDDIRDELQAAEAAAAEARAEAERFRQAPGLRGRVVRWLARGGGKGARDGR